MGDLNKRRITHIWNGPYFKRMTVEYYHKCHKFKIVKEGNYSTVEIPGNAEFIEVKFQNMRFVNTWCDVKKYDREKLLWCKPTVAHVFKFEKPVTLTFILEGSLYYPAVMKVTDEQHREVEQDAESCVPCSHTDVTTETDDWKKDVKIKLFDVFKEHPEEVIRILKFLDEEDKAYKDTPSQRYAPQWKSLKSTLQNEEAFRMRAQRLADDTKKAVKDPQFRYLMNKCYQEMMHECDDKVSVGQYQKSDIHNLAHLPTNTISASCGLSHAWSIMPVETKVSVLNNLNPIGDLVAGAGDSLFDFVSECGGPIVMVALSSVYLTYKAVVNIRRWYKGEISGKRCMKNVLDATFTLVGGVTGGIVGAIIGGLAGGPIGALAGGGIGGWVSSSGAKYFSDIVTQNLFGIPKDEGLENAYRYLGVKMTATNSEVNAAFHKLCLKHHPDKGGRTEDFVVLQCHMSTIKAARGDL